MEKMQVDEQNYTAKVINEEVKPKVTFKPISSKWVKDEVQATKTCEACGAVMRGWAYREKFLYCPMCGAKMDG